MTVITDKGNFGSFKDLMLDMQYEHYNTVNVIRTEHISNQIMLDGLGLLTVDEVRKLAETM